MKKAVVIAIVLAVLLIPQVVSAASGIDIVDWDGDGYWRHDTWYVDLYPGEEVSAGLRIESSEDVVVYAEYDTPEDLQVYFEPPVLEIEEGDSEWLEITIRASGSIEPGEYEIDFYFEVVETSTKIIYRDRYLPGPVRYVGRIEYVDKVRYVDREVPEYVYVERGVAWWWIPISAISAILALQLVILLGGLVRRRRDE